MQAHILSLIVHSTPGWGQRSKHFFYESRHVEYQMNGNGAQSTHAST